MRVPDWWTLILLAGGSFRTWRFLAEDDLIDRPRRWALRLPASWEEGDPAPRGYRQWWGDLIRCSFCLGAWVSLALYAAWQAWPHGTLVVAAPLAISALVGLAGRLTG